MTPRAVWAMGVGQCVNWGVLYYAFSVLVVPIEQDLGVARWVVMGVFSVALLVSAVAAPSVGRVVDRGLGAAVMQAGGLLAAGLLLVWAAAPGVTVSYIVWIGVGACMAAVLYEPAFAMVGQAFADAGDRLRAIATITVCGGFASTIFLPFTQVLVDGVGWRGAVVVLALCVAGATVLVFPEPVAGTLRRLRAEAQARPRGAAVAAAPVPLGLLVPIFAGSSFVNAALSANLVPALIDRTLAPAAAATMAGLFGVMQLPGRLLLMRGSRAIGPAPLLAASFALQMLGLVALAAFRSGAGLAGGVVLFAGGAGLATLARPYLVLDAFGPARAGEVNGRIARTQHFARAAGPIAAAALAGAAGYGVVFLALAAVLAFAGAGIAAGRRSERRAGRRDERS